MHKKDIMSLIVFILLIGQFTFTNAQQSLQVPEDPVWDNVPEEIRNTNAFKRYEWFYRNREDQSGNFPKTFIEEQKVEEIRKVKNIVQKGNKLQTTSDAWSNIGPSAIDMTSSFIPHWGSVSGRVRGLAVHPTNPDIVYIGAAAGGIWKTVDGGANWTDMSGELNLLTFGAIAIDPSNPNTIYAGTGESILSFNTTTYEGNGLYKSTDGGVSWTKITIGTDDQTHFADIEVSPHNSNIILAALGSGNWNNSSPSNEGIWQSSDAGATWIRVADVTDGFDVAFHPSNTTLAYASSGNNDADGGFLISTNSGASFTQSNTGLPAPTDIGRIHFSIAPSNTSTIYALIYNSIAFASGHTTVAFKSTDGGANWSQISSGTNIAGAYDDNGINVNDQGSYDLCLDVSPADANVAFFGNVELSSTSDGSTISFVRKTPKTFANPGAWDAPMHVDIHKIVFAPSNSNYLYVGCDGGIYKSTDGGATFTSVNNNLNTIQFYRLASDNNNVNKIFGGAQDNGNFSTDDRGATDWEFETSGDGMECFVDYNNSLNVFMSTQNGSLKRSTDGGVNWTTVDYIGSAAWTAPFWQHPTNSSQILAAINGQIRLSNSSGASGTWIWYSGLISGQHVTSVAHSPVTTTNMIAVSSYFNSTPPLNKSSDGGLNWSSIYNSITSSGFSHTSIQRAVADPSDGNTFYLCRVSYWTGQILKTTDFGTTWTDISGNLPKIAHNDLFIDPANTNHLYAANDFGVYWSNNGGTDWHKLSNGMPFVPVLDFDFYENGSTRLLRAASHGRGVFELQIDTPLEKIYVDLKVFLEGPYSGAGMNTNISSDIPKAQPFNTAPFNYAGTETSPAIPNDIVDWVYVEMRSGTTPATATTIEDKKAGLLKSDGTIVDVDGVTNLNFDLAPGNYYIVIYSRNHLPIMTPTAVTIN